MKKNHLLPVAALLIFSFIMLDACSKSSATAMTDPCTGVAIAVSGTVTNADAGTANGSITATASGSAGLTFSLNNGPAQSSGTFSKLSAGVYTVTAKNASGCSGSATITVKTADACTGKTPGPTFTAVTTVISTNCAISGCHNGTQAPDYTADCTIVDYADLIKQRVVDQAGTATQMPQPPRAALAPSDRAKITAWIAAGKHITD